MMNDARYYVDEDGISHWICARCGEPILEPDDQVKQVDPDIERYYHAECYEEEMR